MKQSWLAFAAGLLGAVAFYSFTQLTPIVKASVPCSVLFTFINGQIADANQVNANNNNFVQCFTLAALAGINSDITQLTGLTTPISPSQGGTQYFWGGASTGSANAQVVTIATPSTGFALSTGVRVSFTPGFSNTGITTLNVAGTGVKSLGRLVQSGSGAVSTANLVGGELVNSNTIVDVVYNGTYWVIVNQGITLVGMIQDFGFSGCTPGWAEATGQNVSSTNFPDINSVLGTIWGTSAGNTVMPDLRGRSTFSRDGTGTRLTADQNGALAGNTVGTTGGVQNQILTLAQLPVFSNTPTWTNSAGTYTPTGTNASSSVSFPNQNPYTTAMSNNGATGSGTSSGYTAGASTYATNNWNTLNGGNMTAPTAASQIWTASNSYTASGTVSSVSFGSGNPHPVTPPLGVVTKCVKL
jgi:microcystin-dependent protein